MRFWKISVFVIAVLMVSFLASGQSSAEASYDKQELKFLHLLNEYRADHGLKPMLLSDKLAESATHHSDDMGKYGFFAHSTYQSSYYPAGSLPWDRMRAEGYGYNTYKGENIAAGYETAQEAFTAWKNSPPHNREMLDEHYKVIGIGRVNVPDTKFGWYWTTDFGGYVDPGAHRANQGGDRDALGNGSMNGDRIWRQYSSGDRDLITEHGIARLGGYNSGTDKLSQKLQVKKDTRLVYRLEISTEESQHPYDMLAVRVENQKGERLDTLAQYTDADHGPWREESVDLSKYKGRTIRISFLAKTDEIKPTTFYLDDVKLK